MMIFECPYCNNNYSTFGGHEKKCPYYQEVEIIERSNAVFIIYNS